MSYTNGVTSSPLLQTLMNQTEGAGQAKSGRFGATGVHAAQDRMQLSTAASALLQTGVEDGARAEKVRSIQAAVANGTYSVSADDVADKLMQNLIQR